jgi:glycosyltransferase involved in cell wall biosynthesis
MFTALPSGYLMPFDRLVCTSDAGEQAYQEMQRQALKSFGIENCAGRGYAQIQTDVIPLGIDVEQFVPGPVVRPERSRLGVCDDEILFLYCGRFSVEFKMDPFPLLAVFAAAFRGQSRVKLVLAGDTAGAGHVRIPEIAHRLGIASQISIISDPSATVKLGLYQAADIFVSFSDNLQETFGLTILEAMSCGLPVVATDWSGYRETVVSGETGFLVPTTWCSPDSYSSKTSPFFPEAATHLLFSQEVSFDMRVAVACMQRLADDPQLRRALGERGRLRAERHYAWQTIAAAYGKLFHSLFDEATVSGTAGQPDAAGYPPFSYDHPAVFGHFATHVQNMPALVQRLADDIAFQAAVEMIAPTAAEMLSAAFRSHEVLPSARLLRELTSVLGQPRAAVRVVQLLLKYGVIAAI